MRLRFLITSLMMILVLSGLAVAQARKPRQALRDLAKRQESLFKDFERDVSDGKAQAWEWEDRAAEIRQSARVIALTYKIADWESDELVALAEMHLLAEDFARAADVYRAVINSDSRRKEVDGVDIRARLAEALIESEQLDAAASLIEELKKERADDRLVMVALVGLYKDLAISLRDRGYLIRAADAAYDGYNVADVNKLARLRSSQLTERVLRDQFTLAALYVALNEQLSKEKTAQDFAKTVRAFDFREQTYLLDHYEKELSDARLIWKTAPELKTGIPVEGQTLRLDSLRGKVVLLDFTALWCAPCAAAFHHWRDFQSRYAGRGFEIIGVTRLYGRTDAGVASSTEDELKAIRDFRIANNLKFPYIVGAIDDVTNEERFGVDSIPTAILIDRNGAIRHVKRGIGDYRKLERVVRRLLDER